MASPPADSKSDTTPPTTISLRAPSKYLSSSTKSEPATTAQSPFISPPLDWLCRTWSVTHSTLSMWQSKRNVRITYKPLEPSSSSSSSAPKIDDLVESEKNNGKGGISRIEGIDTPDPSSPGSWDWRGKGWLKIASSHWEVLGWGERPLMRGLGDMGEGVERWVVTWFAATLFTKEGVDIYCDRREGPSPETVEMIMRELKALDAAPTVVQLVEREMRDVEIKLPWKEKN
ncbi:uncharacterized protein BCR38DRAFT_111927 [Pseudomassariella vexata]|uniref:Histidinolphosphatase-like protein n=1 Tax=Pseudomassariella vexata TaxID=1141098 RepID=A0A1Y2DC73_9PEZI|nr:uncharacterized protein BCR38DRAFT_111927 [Pseudomassariella vexata]ORY56870.1 hypothetical protein BCR38DRAFT_111927 [Pseudomassariella vexata]